MNIDEIKNAAEQDNLEAVLQLGVMYYNGDGVEKHLTNAINCWKKVAQSDNKELAVKGCQHLIYHFCLLKSYGEAKEWALREHALGSQDGLLFLGLELYQNYEQEKGVDLIMKVAKEGNTIAQEHFVRCYQEGCSNNVGYSDEVKAYWRELQMLYVQRTQNTESNQQYQEQTPYSSHGACNDGKITLNKIKKYISLAVFVVVVLVALWEWITPTVIVIDNNKQYERFTSFSAIRYVSQHGETINITEHKPFNTYIYNASQRDVIGYRIIYTDSKSEIGTDEPNYNYTISPHKLSKVDNCPDFFFEEPNSISVSEGFWESLYHDIFGRTATRWILDYVPNAEDLQKYQLSLEKEFISSHSLQANEYTDGRIIFKAPDNYECHKEYFNDSTSFSYLIVKENLEVVKILSGYGSNQVPQNEEMATVWENWKDEELKDSPAEIVKEETKVAGHVHYFYKEVLYRANSPITWKFMVLYDVDTNKFAVVTSYILDHQKDCFDDVVKSVKFK